MDRGHIPDVTNSGVAQSGWAPGDPEVRRFVGGIKYHADEVIPILAYRCSACGYVEFYAPRA